MSNYLDIGLKRIQELIDGQDKQKYSKSTVEETINNILKMGTSFARSLAMRSDYGYADNSKNQIDNLCDSIHNTKFDFSTNTAYIFSDALSYTSYYDKGGAKFQLVPYMKFVEFGTGILGEITSQEGSNSPNIPPEWEYDVNDHLDKGWVFVVKELYGHTKKPFRFTRGMVSTPIMTLTAEYLNELFRLYLPNENIQVKVVFEEVGNKVAGKEVDI